MRAKLLFSLLAVSLLALSACGETPGCRALTGAGIGAAGGAVLAFVGDEAIASARFKSIPDGLYVGRVAVLPGYRRRGNKPYF